MATIESDVDVACAHEVDTDDHVVLSPVADEEARAKIAALEAQVGGLLELVVSESTRLDQTITGFVLKNDGTDQIKGDIFRLQKRQYAMEETVSKMALLLTMLTARIEQAEKMLGIVPAEPVVSGSSCCNENCNGREGGACSR